MNDRGSEGTDPEDPAATIARLQMQIEGLQRRISDDRFAQDLRDAMTTASATGAIGAPVGHTRLMEMIVAAAADIVDATAASLFLIDDQRQELVFEAAFGEHGEEAAEFRVPVGGGIAGLVALTGQPMAIADTAEEGSDVAEIAQAVGYIPKSVLCVPLSFQDRVIGVLQLMDKLEDETFSVTDMEDIGSFANLAAVTVEQSRTHTRLGAMVSELVATIDGMDDYDRHGLTQRARQFTGDLGRDTGYLAALELARIVQEIVHHGEDASTACASILNGFAKFLRTRPMTAGELGGITW
jgi:GAF domain-containing protein